MRHNAENNKALQAALAHRSALGQQRAFDAVGAEGGDPDGANNIM